MSKRSDPPTSASRRRFFREMFVSAVEGVEKVGKQFAQRNRFPFPYDEPDHASTDQAVRDYSHLYSPEYRVYGPPWPPPYGPPVPQSLREERRRKTGQSVARSEDAQA